LSKLLPRVQLREVLRHCPEIDSLRALAMIGVVAMHSKLLPFGWAGVWLFFVISGYVVTLSIARTNDPRRPLQGAAHFARHRIGRILPPYYAYLLVGMAVSLALSIQQPREALLSLFGFYHNIAMANGKGDLVFWPVGHLWTISVEMQFYLFYGLVAYFAPLAVTRRVLWACVVLAPLGRLLAGALLAAGDPEAVAYTIYSAPGLHFDSFAIGCLFALARLTVPLDRMLGPIVRIGFISIAVYALAFVMINVVIRERTGIEALRDVVSGILYGEGREVFLYTSLALASLALLALTVARHPLVQPITGLRPLQWIGKISYGCYIYHNFCLLAAAFIVSGKWDGIGGFSIPARIAVFVIGLGLTLAVAQLSWRFLERPAMALVKGRGSSRRAASSLRISS
jgi:peptidoglycan/LPS O-acetylase OafA/YrhL